MSAELVKNWFVRKSTVIRQKGASFARAGQKKKMSRPALVKISVDQ